MLHDMTCLLFSHLQMASLLWGCAVLAAGAGFAVPLAAAQSKGDNAEARVVRSVPVQAALADTSLTGTWRGVLDLPGGGSLRIAFRFAKDDAGRLTATMESPDQGSGLIPVSRVTRQDDSLRLAVDAIGGAYSGQIGGDADAIAGTWQQGGQAFPLSLERAPEASATPTSEGERRQPGEPDVTGLWLGALTLPTGDSLRIVFDIAEAEDGTLSAEAVSPDQGGARMPVSGLRLRGDSLHVEIAAVGAAFKGVVAGGAEAVEGQFAQGGVTLPLTLRRTDAVPPPAAPPARPQTPEPPFPYASEDVVFENATDGFALAGTLTLPEGEGPHPAAVVISGSGPQDRDGTVAAHPLYLVLADHLTRQGIAVLRFDERGVGASGGTFAEATSEDFARDAAAALRYLRARPEIAASEVGLIGHSEGALVAPRAALDTGEAAFLVLLAGPGVRGDTLLARQNALIFGAMGMSAEGAAAYEARMLPALARLQAVPPTQPLPDSLRAALRADFQAAAEAMTPADRAVYGPTDSTALALTLDQLAGQLATPWMRYFLAYDPAPALRRVEAPTLALFGAKDLQVPPAQNAEAVRQALTRSQDATVRTLPGLNHLFQTAQTGSPSEYARIEETMAPAALNIISTWIRARTSVGAE